jgi:outer membrane immunogenic protein
MRGSFMAAAAVAASLAIPATTHAVDLPVPASEAPVSASADPTWTGLYIGGHVGRAWADFEGETSFTAETFPIPDVATGVVTSNSFEGPDLDDDRFLAGAQAGMNLQVRRVVLGVEGDFSWLGLEDSTDYEIPAAELTGAGLGAIVETVDGFVSEQEREIEWLATFRGRFGIASRRVLVYATGGIAVAETSSETEFSALVGDTVVSVSDEDSDRRLGWTVGGGVEAGLTRHVSAKLEYLYTDLGTEDQDVGTYIDIPDVFHQSVSSEDELILQLLRFGLNYRF